jgi:membrane associated rhomboid family serine protease
MNLSIASTPVSLLLIAIIGVVSYLGFSKEELIRKTIFSPYRIKHTNEWYRFLTSGFIHADWMHLIFNMYAFALFAGVLEQVFDQLMGAILGKLALVGLFVLGVVFSHISTYIKHKNDAWYQSLGASGGVASVLFAFIFLFPLQKMYGLPMFVVGLIYLGFSNYLARKGSNDNTNHDAHYYGGVWGILFVIGIYPDSLFHFINEVTTWGKSFF